MKSKSFVNKFAVIHKLCLFCLTILIINRVCEQQYGYFQNHRSQISGAAEFPVTLEESQEKLKNPNKLTEYTKPYLVKIV